MRQRQTIAAVLGILGAVCIIVGAAMVAPWAGWLTAGVLGIAADVAMSRPSPPPRDPLG